jgi:hypothetical protein
MQHCAVCADCGPLVTALRDREYTAATILNGLPPISNPISVAETAAMVSHRRRLGKVAVFLTGAALVATVTASLFVTNLGRSIVGADGPELRTETFPLKCLTPEQAGGMIEPYLRTNGAMYYPTPVGVSAITVRGTPAQIAKSRELIHEFENGPQACRTDLSTQFRALEKLRQDMENAAPVVAPSPEAAPSLGVEPTPKVPTVKKK